MPGERGPSSVPMMPLADFVALSGSLSNHSSRKSAELMVKLGQHAEPLWRPAAKMLAKALHAHKLAEGERGRIRRRHGEQRLHRACHLVQHEAELIVRLGVAQRMARGSRRF